MSGDREALRQNRDPAIIDPRVITGSLRHRYKPRPGRTFPFSLMTYGTGAKDCGRDTVSKSVTLPTVTNSRQVK